MRHLRPAVLRSLLVVTGAAAAAHAAVDPSLFQDLHWRSIGPFRGGRVLAVAGVPGEPLHFYFGAVNGGVWETTDAGRTWQPIFDGQPVGAIGALAVAPSDPKVLYVGTGEADMRNDISQGDGMYRSADGGRTWRHVGLADSQQIGRVLVHPNDANVVYVAALGHPYGPNPERGVFRSRDGGATWQKLLGPNDDTGAVDLAFEPGNPAVIYAALWQTRRTPWHVYPPSNGPGSSVWKSTDGGEHWTQLGTQLGGGLPATLGKVGFAIAPVAPQRVYAVVDAEPGGGVYRSDDAGATWRKTSGDTRLWGRGWYFGRLAVDPNNADRVWVLNTIVLYSEDGGTTFLPQKGDTTGDDFHEMWIDPADSKRQILGVDQGAIVTLNGGVTWSSWHNQPTAQIYALATDNRFPYFVYGSQQDSGAAGVPSRTTSGGGINLTAFREITAGGESDAIAPDPKDPDVIYGGRVDRLDLRTRQTRSVDPTLTYPDSHRSAWTQPLEFSHRDPSVLYFAYQNLYRTADHGEQWTQISPDLTRENPGTPANLDPPSAALNVGMGPRRGLIFTIAPSRRADHDLWVGTDDGLVWRTRDEGASWQNITPPAVTAWSKIAGIETSPHDAETAYVAVDRHYLDDFRPYVYRTHDGGQTWQLVVDGIAERCFVNAVREDPVRRGLLFAGCELGVYVSFDDGEHWQSLQLNLPVTSVRDLEVKTSSQVAGDLVIATHGRGFWILDDITPLRQLPADAAPSEPLLVAPAAAFRVRPEGFTGTPFPKDEVAASNPPFGAYVDYVLPTAAAAPVELAIRDADGRLVRRYSSADVPPPIDLGRLGSAPEWVKRPVTLAASPGMHRFVWPLREGAPGVLTNDNPYGDGVWAPPGRYTVELAVDGRTLRQPLEVLPDPRVDLPAAAYAEQHALAREIEVAQVSLAVAADAAGELQKALAARRATADAKAAALLDAFQDKLTAVRGFVVASNPSSIWWLPPKSLTSLRAMDDVLSGLRQAVDGADAAPSPDARAGFAKAQAMLPTALASWERLRTVDLPALQKALAKARQPAVAWPKPQG